MKTVHIRRINAKRGKQPLGLLLEMVKTGRDIEFGNIPNDDTVKAINDARVKKGMKAKSVDDLFAQLYK